jgi:hypothetical protein
MYLDTDDVCIKSDTGKVKLLGMTEIEDLQLPGGSLYSKSGDQKLYWKTEAGYVDITEKGITELPKKFEPPIGDVMRL